MRHCSTLGKASVIVSFQAKQNNKQTSPFNISDNLNIKCDTEDLFFNCPRDWWMIRKKSILDSGSVQLLRLWSPFTVPVLIWKKKLQFKHHQVDMCAGRSVIKSCSLLLVSDACVLEIAFCTGFSVSVLLGHLPWFPSLCDRLVFNTALLVESHRNWPSAISPCKQFLK